MNEDEKYSESNILKDLLWIDNSEKPIVRLLKICAWVVFISGFLYGFVTFMLAVISVSFLPQSFSNIMGVLFIPVFSILIKAFLRGAGFLFLAELLKVLEGIKNK